MQFLNLNINQKIILKSQLNQLWKKIKSEKL